MDGACRRLRPITVTRLEEKHGPPAAARPESVGSARLEGPEVVVADSYATVTVVYTAGALGVDDGGRVRLAFRFPSDFEPPQFDDPGAPNYCHVSCSREVKLTPTYESPTEGGGFRPFVRSVTVCVTEGSLAPGDELRVTFGETRWNSPGWRVQTYAEKRCVLLVLVDPLGTNVWETLPERPAVEVVNGPGEKLFAILPTEALVGEEFELFLRVEDKWGNVARDFEGSVELKAIGSIRNLPGRVRFTADSGGLLTIGALTASGPGHVRVRATMRGGDEAVSNPLTIGEDLPTGGLRPFWGDLHAQSGETVGAGAIADYFDHARNAARLDFTSHQGNCFQVSEEKWRLVCEAARAANEPGRFVVFPGYEWSANEHLGGDHNVYFLDEKQPIRRASSWLTWEGARDEGYLKASDLYEALDAEESIVSHHIGGRPGNLEYFGGEALEPFIEIHSCWGTFEWFWREALERGLKTGFACGSDDHRCRPGTAHPGRSGFGTGGGLVCALAGERTRESIWKALKARRVYGTTGARIGVRFSCDGNPMGSEVEMSGSPEKPGRSWPEFQVRIAGTGPVEFVELWRAQVRSPDQERPGQGRPGPSGLSGESTPESWRGEVGPVDRHTPWDQAAAPDDLLRVMWGGSLRRGRRRAAVWDGSLEVDGPEILSATPVGFAAPGGPGRSWSSGHLSDPTDRASSAQGIEQASSRRVRWHSTTTGGRHGVVLQLSGWRGDLLFRTPLYDGEWSIAEIGRDAGYFRAGGLDLHVEIARIPKGPVADRVETVLRDVSPRPGLHAYCLRIRQLDAQMAWTSPIFVDVAGPIHGSRL